MQNKSRQLYRVGAFFLAIVLGLTMTLSASAANEIILGTGVVSLTDLTTVGDTLYVTYNRYNDHDDASYGSGTKAVVENNKIKCIADGYKKLINGRTSTIEVILKNNSETATQTLSFNVNTGSINGGSVSYSNGATISNNTHTIELAPGATYTVTLKSGSNKDSIVYLENVQLISNDSITVKYIAPTDPSGSKIGDIFRGDVNLNSTTAELEEDDSGLTISAPNYRLAYWQAEDGSTLGVKTTGFRKPTIDSDRNGDGVVEVTPYMVPSTAGTYRVDGVDYYYWEDAFTAAKAGGKKVILIGNGTLPGSTAYNKTGTYAVASEDGTSVTYTIPSDCYFLIPCSEADITNGGTFGSGDDFDNASTAAPSAFRTLTVASGANIICNGNMNINGHRTEYTQPHSGRAAGGHGKMVLEGSGTQLTVNGTLYCYGFISGNGQVELNGNLYELLQMASWNGGSYSTAWVGAADENSILFLTSYYVQNVEADLKVNASGHIYVETVVSGDCSSIPVIGTSLGVVTVRKTSTFVAPAGSTEGLFLLGSGTYLKRTYDSSSDRVTYTVGGSGEVDFGSIIIEAEIVPEVLGVKMDSSQNILPVSGAMTVVIDSNVTMNMGNKAAILPGGQIIINENATVNLSNHLHIFDIADWKDTMFYQSTSKNLATPQYYTVGRGQMPKLSVTESGYLEINGCLNISGSGGIYSTNGITDVTESSSDIGKIIHGKGTIKHEGTQTEATLKTGFTDTLTPINTMNAVGRLAGITDSETELYDPFGTRTYYGLGDIDGDETMDAEDQYWYNYIVTAVLEDGTSGVSYIRGDEFHRSTSTTVTRYVPATTSTAATNQTVENVVGFFTYDSAGNQSVFNFTVPACITAVTAHNSTDNTETSLTPDENGVYSLTDLSSDIVLKLTGGHIAEVDAAVAATCTETGLTEGSHCSVCNEVLVKQEVIAANGHTPAAAVEENRVEADFGKAGSYDSVVYCSVCGSEISRETITIPAKVAVAEVNGQKYESVAEALEAVPVGGTITLLSTPDASDTPAFNKSVKVEMNEVAYEINCAAGWEAVANDDETVYTVQKVPSGDKFHIYAANVNMGNNLDMLFAIPVDAVTDWAGHYVEIVRSGSAEASEDETITIKYEDGWVKNGSFYVITYGGFDAKEMCDTITLTVYDSNKNPVSYPWTDSIRAYAMRILGSSTDDRQKTVVVDMLNFGAAAQLHFGYGTDKLANALLTETQKQGSTANEYSDAYEESRGDKFNKANLVVTSHIQYMVAFNELTDDMTATITYTGHKENEETFENVQVSTLETGGLCFIVEGLVVADARYPITITVYNKDGSVYTTCTDSIEAYISRKAADSPVFTAFMKFADSAHAFKHDGSYKQGGTE